MNSKYFESERTSVEEMEIKNSLSYGQMSEEEIYNQILLVEDNPGDAHLVELLLGESDLLNCKITHKTTLTEAMACLEENDGYAAILLDLSLPDSRGFVTLEKLLAKYPKNNVIVLTGLADKNLGIKAVKTGAQDFLIKGNFDSDTLAKSLRYSIERNKVLQRLEDTQRLAHVGNWEYKLESNQFTASDEIYRIFNLKERVTNFSIEDFEEIGHPFHIFKSIHEETLGSKKISKDIEIKQAGGGLRFVSIQCSVNKSEDNETIFSGIIQDITDRKKSEQDLIKSQERYQDIFTKSKDAIFICTLDGKFIDFNRATLDLFGYTKEELLLKDANDFYESDAKENFLEKLEERKAVTDFEIEIEQKSGITKYCLINANLIESEGQLIYNAIVRDITEQKQTDELRKARDLARQSAQMKEQFIASISHEMRTPMNAILGMSNLVIQTDLNTEQHDYISSIKQSSEILLGIINDILEISTIQTGKIKFENKDFDLNQLLKNLMNVMRYKVKEKSLQFELIKADNVPRYIKGDKLRLNQVLYNLVGNAIKFTDSGYVKIFVENLSESTGSVMIKFTVADSGIGIPADRIDAVFETFTRVRTKDRIYEGTGLGLSIAKNLVEQQGGKIGLESTLGLGSKFFFDMIFETGEEVSESTPDAPEEIIALENNRGLRLLLVEDHKMNQLVARKTLEKHWDNIDITIADNGQIAIEILKEKKFDIILMDIQMPIMDGYETTKYIRNKMPAEVAQLPILAMTAHAHVSKDEKYKEYGMDDFVLKPFDPKQLFQKIAKYI
ncbi:MAG TPA: response regulator, partial [Saprospiraceae bacterium]|nr:response regulator [Saprospiraceae bacterium]